MDYNDISIITLVRNNLHLLHNAINSLLNQTNKNWTNIIIDDYSHEKVSYEYLKKILPNDIYENNKHKFNITCMDKWNGIVKLHNMGIDIARTEIIGILDADDMLEPTAIESILNEYNVNKNNVFVCSNFYYCDDNYEISRLGFGKEINKSLLNDRCFGHFRTFKKSYAIQINGYGTTNEFIFGAEDRDFMYRLEEICKPIFIDKPLYYYRKTSDHISICMIKKAANKMHYYAILKNIKHRFGNLNCYFEIYSNIIPFERKIMLKEKSAPSMRKIKNIVVDNTKYIIVLKSNDIFIADSSVCNITDDAVQFMIHCFLNEKVKKHNITHLSWNDGLNKFNVLDETNDQINDNIYDCDFVDTLCVTNCDLDKFKKISILDYFSAITTFDDLQTIEFNKIIKLLITNITITDNNKYMLDDFLHTIPYDWKILYYFNENSEMNTNEFMIGIDINNIDVIGNIKEHELKNTILKYVSENKYYSYEILF